MTKTIKRLLPAALAVLLAGCAMQPVDSTTTRYRVALVAKNNRDSEFWDAVFTGAEAAATEYNLQLTITAPDDEEDYAAQNQLIADAVENGAQAIVFSAIDYEANAAAIDAAAAAGVTVISVDSAVNSDNVAAYIGADNYGAGRMAAQSALDGMEGALCVGLINYEVNGANGRDREQGARDAFAESGRARITAAVSTHPNAASARADTLAMLRTHPEINVLIALNETTAVGAAQAVQQMQRADDLWLAAFDSNIETIDALQTGAVDALIVQNTYGMGYFGVESAYKLLTGQESSVEKSNISPHFAQHCTACQLCVSVCPNQVLRPSSDLTKLMQPEMSYERGYCRPECAKCAEVCPTDAIHLTSLAEKSAVQIGHAVWIKENCICITDKMECGNCARHCPAGAIQMVPSDPEDEASIKIPVVNAERCIGCGACENLCPSRPFSAIYVEGHVMHRTV